MSLYDIVDEAKSEAKRFNRVRRNPPPGIEAGDPNVEPVSQVTIFQELVKERGYDSTDEHLMAEAARELGVKEADIPEFLEEFASFL